MKVSAEQIKKLRAQTGAGILDVKVALEKANGDFHKATAYLQEAGLAKITKKAAREASEGIVGASFLNELCVMLEINCETDFVARTKEFQTLFNDVLKSCLSYCQKTQTLDLEKVMVHGQQVHKVVQQLGVKTGENLVLRRGVVICKNANQTFGVYNHNNNRVSAVVVVENGTLEVGKNLAMHLAALAPMYLSDSDVPKDIVQKLQNKIKRTLEGTNKPLEIMQRIIAGKLAKELEDVVFLNQELVTQQGTKVKAYLSFNNAKLVKATRFALGSN